MIQRNKIYTSLLAKLINSTLSKIFFVSLLLTLILIAGGVSISKEYFKTHTFFYDPGMSHSRTFPFYERMQEEAELNPITSRINFAIVWFKSDPRSVFLYVPTILLYPKLMGTPYASIISVGIMLFCFLFTLAISLYIRKYLLLFISSILLLFISAPFLTHAEYGIAAGWHDLPASLFLASGILSFLNWRYTNKIVWIIASSIFIACAIMSRSHFIVFSGILFFVPVIVTYIERYRNNQKTLIPYITLIGLIIIGIIPFFYFHFVENFSYYYKNPMPTGVASSWYMSFKYLLDMIPRIGIIYTIFLCLLFIIVIVKGIRKNIFSKIICYWLLVILPLLWVFILQTGNTYHVYSMLFPIIFIIFLAFPFTIQKYKYLFFCIVLFSIFSFIYGYSENYTFAQNPSVEAQDYKKINTVLASYIKDLDDDEMWGPFFEDDYARLVNCESYYKYGVYPEKYPATILYRSQIYWDAIYKEQNDGQIVKKYIDGLANYSLIITYKNKEDIEKKSYTDSHTTLSVLYAIYNEINKTKVWKEVEIINTQKFGELAIYKKSIINH